MAAVTAINVENPRKPADLNSSPTTEEPFIDPPAITSEAGAEKSAAKSEEVASKTSDAAAVTDIEKKMKRAERFGMSFKLTEEEKRNTRAERFGTGTTVKGSSSSIKSEELKRKARAERFGAPQIASADEEEKKKARVTSFGSISRTDSVEEDKKKARGIRFSQHASSLSKGIGKSNIEAETAITGDAGVGT